MTCWQNTKVLPPKAYSFVKKLKCPLCKNKVVSEGDKFSGMWNSSTQEYMAFSCCEIDGCPYSIDFYWRGISPIIINSEQIEFQYDNKDYLIEKQCLQEEKVFIRISPLDETDGSKSVVLRFEEDHFNFKKFNAKKFAELIKTLIIFQ